MGKKNKNQSLGRGLDAILGEVARAYENELDSDREAWQERIIDISLDEIRPNPYQPRKHFDEVALRELAESIKQHGLLQPVVVIEQEDGYLLVAGERRVRASRLAGLDTIKAIVADVQMERFRELALIENIQRESLNPVELAKSYKELIEEHHITQEALAQMLHKSRTHIANTLRLLQLDGYVLERLESGALSQGHAKVLVGLMPEQQRVACDTIVGQKLSVRDTEKMVGEMKAPKEKKGEKAPAVSVLDLTPYRTLIAQNTPFQIKVKKDRLEIAFANEEELKGFIRRMSREL